MQSTGFDYGNDMRNAICVARNVDLSEWPYCSFPTQPKIISCNRLLKTGLNNVVLPTLFNDVNNIVQHCYTRLRARFRLNNLFNIVDNN